MTLLTFLTRLLCGDWSGLDTFFFFFFFFFNSKPRPFRRNSTIEQQCEQWAARIWKAALGNVAAGSIQLRRPEVSASTQERRAMYGGGGERMKGG